MRLYKDQPLAVAAEGESVSSQPAGMPWPADDLAVPVTPAKPPVLPAGRSEPTQLPVLVDGVAQPVDAGVSTDGLVLRVHQYDFVELEHRVLSDPVGVEDSECPAVSPCSLLHKWSECNTSICQEIIAGVNFSMHRNWAFASHRTLVYSFSAKG